MTDAELYIFLFEAFLIGLGLGAIILSLYKWGFRGWDFFYRRYVQLEMRVRLMQLPNKIDTAFFTGALLMLVSIWTEDTKYLQTGLWLMGITLFLYLGRREDESS